MWRLSKKNKYIKYILRLRSRNFKGKKEAFIVYWIDEIVGMEQQKEFG